MRAVKTSLQSLAKARTAGGALGLVQGQGSGVQGPVSSAMRVCEPCNCSQILFPWLALFCQHSLSTSGVDYLPVCLASMATRDPGQCWVLGAGSAAEVHGRHGQTRLFLALDLASEAAAAAEQGVEAGSHP